MSNSWPADKVERWPIARLVPSARNARTHSDAQVAQVAASIREWGWTTPVLVDEAGTLIAGHARTLAAQKLGITEVPVMVATGWTEAQKRAYTIADNKLAINADWDVDLLRVEFGDLKMDGFNLDLMGFSGLEMADLLAERNAGLTDPDDVPEPPAEPVSRLGDVWLLGRHRLCCGDAASEADVAILTAGVCADLCFTSPPYLQQRAYETCISDWDALMQGVFSLVPAKTSAQLLINLGMVHRNGEWLPYWESWIAWMRDHDWQRFGWYVWDQGFGLPGGPAARLNQSHEFIFHFKRESDTQKTARKSQLSRSVGRTISGGLRGQDGAVMPFSKVGQKVAEYKIPDSVFRVTRHMARGIEIEHPAVFPVDLVSEVLTAFSDPDDTVYEPFAGSGTQIISAQKNGRSCLAMEIAPRYVDISIVRWQNFSGQTARLEANGRSFAEVAAERKEMAQEPAIS